MTKERLKSPRARLFVALDLPAGVRSQIDAWGEAALADPALRRVAPEALHITLAFLGFRAEREIPRIAEVVHAVRAPAPRLEILPEPAAVTSRGRQVALYALDVRSPATVALQAKLQAELISARLYEAEKRPFWPHVTVARVRREKGERNRQRVVENPPGEVPAALCEAFDGVRVTLYRSQTMPQGAEYTPLAQVELFAATDAGQR